MRCCQTVEIRRKCVDEVSLEGREVKNTIVITFAFQVVFTAFNALQNLHSSLHHEESLGNICLAILYGTAILSSILSPTIIGLIGAKSVIVAAFAAHCIYVLANFYPSFSTMAPAAVALGAFHGPAWTSQALYISASAFSFSKSSSASPYTILSRFNGFFFAVFATAQIPGNLVTSTIIKSGVGNGTDEVIKFCGPEDCPHYVNSTNEDPEEWVIDITLGFLMACALLGLFLVVFLLTPLPRSEWIQKVSVWDTATSCFKVLVTPNMILLVPFIFFTAAEHAFLMSAYTKSYITCPIGIHMVGYVMAVYGATTPVFVYIFSHLARIAGRFLLLTISLTTHIILFIILFKWTPEEEDKAVIFIIPIVWGVSESILQAQANALIAMLFPSQKEPAFANFHAWRSMGYAITFLNASYMCVSTKLIVCMSFGGLGTILYMVVELKAKMKEKLALKKSRPSIVSEIFPGEIKPKSTGVLNKAFSDGICMESFQKTQDHHCFDRVELTDIISEAQQGWRRGSKGLVLELNKVMSQEHLAGSKVTNWFHTGPLPFSFLDVSNIPAVSQRGIPRSLSDGHLLHNAAKVDERIENMRREKIHTVTGNGCIDTASKSRKISDKTPNSFHVIPEIVCEEDFAVENETKTDFDTVHYSNRENCDFENFEHDTNEQQTEDIVKNCIDKTRCRQESFTNDNQSVNGSKRSNIYSKSSPGDSLVNSTFEPEDSVSYYNGSIVFALGETTPSVNGHFNRAFESDDAVIKKCVSAPNFEQTTAPFLMNGMRPERLVSNDYGYLSENTEDTSSFTNDSSVASKGKPRPETNSKKITKKNRKGKMISVLRALRLSKKSYKEGSILSDSSYPDERNLDNVEDEDDEGNHSDADSNGFANDFEDTRSYVTVDVSDIDKPNRKTLIPINETEDVTCIY